MPQGLPIQIIKWCMPVIVACWTQYSSCHIVISSQTEGQNTHTRSPNSLGIEGAG